jgi:hypothetical protein
MDKRYKTNVEDPFWSDYSYDSVIASAEVNRKKQDAILEELGFKLTFDSVMALLKDEERLKVVVSKLKMKAFW